MQSFILCRSLFLFSSFIHVGPFLPFPSYYLSPCLSCYIRLFPYLLHSLLYLFFSLSSSSIHLPPFSLILSPPPSLSSSVASLFRLSSAALSSCLLSSCHVFSCLLSAISYPLSHLLSCYLILFLFISPLFSPLLCPSISDKHSMRRTRSLRFHL